MAKGRYFGRSASAALIAFMAFGCAASTTAPDTEAAGGWHAIVAFTDTGAVSEDWNWFLDDIRKAAAAAKEDIQVVHAGPGVKTVVIGPEDAPLARIDIGRYRKHSKGYLFIENGRETLYQPYGQSADTLRAASGYFGVGVGPRLPGDE